jgi:hypothetical protein
MCVVSSILKIYCLLHQLSWHLLPEKSLRVGGHILTPLSSHQAGVTRGEGKCCIAELTRSFMSPLCEDGG